MNFILTHTHRIFDYADPQESAVSLVDLVEHCSHLYRFGGAGIRSRITVLQHSIIAAYLHPTLGMLAHDLHEAYCADVPAPMKPLIPDYCALEDKVARVVRRALKVPEELTPEEVATDKLLAKWELKHCMGWQDLRAPEIEIDYPLFVLSWPIEEVKRAFWIRWEQLA